MPSSILAAMTMVGMAWLIFPPLCSTLFRVKKAVLTDAMPMVMEGPIIMAREPALKESCRG